MLQYIVSDVFAVNVFNLRACESYYIHHYTCVLVIQFFFQSGPERSEYTAVKTVASVCVTMKLRQFS